MSEVTHQQVELLLHIYDLRREPRLRQARSWYVGNFSPPASLEEFTAKYPMGSEDQTSFRMVTSYWDMVAGIANRGLIDEELFFESSGELWLVWEKVKGLAPAWRAAFKMPHLLANLEECARRYEAWREKRAPGANEAMRQFFAQMAQTRAQASGA